MKLKTALYVCESSFCQVLSGKHSDKLYTEERFGEFCLNRLQFCLTKLDRPCSSDLVQHQSLALMRFCS